MLLLIAQTVFAARGDLRTHRALGNFGIGYGVVVWLVGLFVRVAAPVVNVNSGRWTTAEPSTVEHLARAGRGGIPADTARRHGARRRLLPRRRAHSQQVGASQALHGHGDARRRLAAAFRLQALGVAIPLAIAIW